MLEKYCRIPIFVLGEFIDILRGNIRFYVIQNNIFENPFLRNEMSFDVKCINSKE